jgi:hypothetical protein
MDELDEVNDKIRKFKNLERVQAWGKRNPEKVKAYRDKWNKEKRREYQRAYRVKNK